MGIEISASGKFFRLETRKTSYLMFVEPSNGYLCHLHYGAPVHGEEECIDLFGATYDGASFCPQREGVDACLSPSLTMQEYTTNEIGDFRISSVSVRTKDGVNSTDPRFVSARKFSGKLDLPGMPSTRVNGDESVETLEVTLADPFSKIECILSYTVFPRQDVIARSVRIRNGSDSAVFVERAMSACLDFPGREFDLIQTSGTYARERFMERNRLHSGVQGFFSKKSSTGHNHSPAFALADPSATESAGEVYGVQLVYSGSHAEEIEVEPYRRVRALCGINPETFEWKLEPGETFQTPEALLTFSNAGLSGMSGNFHDVLREHLIPARWSHSPRPILVNNWEATYFGFNREKLLSIAKDASTLGIEMLVLDDGWFGHRNDDATSLGDWFVNESKIGSLGQLSRDIHSLGLKFGLWFEPEMISEDSELYKAHPEWVFTVPGRDRSVGRTQFVLNMTEPAVVDYLFNIISGVLRSAEIEYIKWDMNRQPAEKFCPALSADRQKEAGHRYVLGVYELHRRLLEAFPDLMIEGCSGGGGRFDAGMLYYCPQIWSSDNQDALDRLFIQSGTSLFYPCSSHGAHVAVCPSHSTGRTTPFATRGNVALSGTFGYELDLNKLSADDRKLVREQTTRYHEVHHLVTDGDFYRLENPGDNPFFASWEFAAKDASEALLLYVRQRFQVSDGARIARLRGLDPARRYRLEGTNRVYRGDLLMNAGIVLPVLLDGDSVLWHFQAV